MAIPLKVLVARVPRSTEAEVDRVRKDANNRIRELIRHETRLSLRRSGRDVASKGGQAEESVSVPVQLKEGLPARLDAIELDDEGWIGLQLSPWRPTLEQLRAGASGAIRMIAEFRETGRAAKEITGEAWKVAEVERWASRLLAQLDSQDPVGRILGVNEDVLGAYHYSVPEPGPFAALVEEAPASRIELYWGVIGVVANMLGVPVSSLAFVVLAHELSHAYTHLGLDIDGHRWRSLDFARTTTGLREGLAQYYTEQVCKGWNAYKPTDRVLEAFHTLLARQPDDYRTHRQWVEEGCAAEEIRLALLSVRRHENGATEEDFSQALTEAHDHLGATA